MSNTRTTAATAAKKAVDPERSEATVPSDWRERPTVSVPVAGLIFGELCKNSAYGAVARGEIPSIRVGHRIMVPVVPLRRMLGELPEAS